MLIVTTETVPGKKVVETFGVVKGNTVRAKHIGKDIVGGLRGIVGGKMKEYEEMFMEARELAEEELIKEAEKLGGNAVIGVRYTSSSIMSGSSEVMVYGTAVRVEDEQ